jgi:hypothetical protein
MEDITMTRNRRWMARASVLAAVLATAACSQQPRHDTGYCSLSHTNNVDRLFAEASENLHDSNCHYHFPEYRERLVAAAKGAPGPENEARFAGLLRESIDLGIISKRQGQEVFSQYFDPEFYAVKSEPRSSCSSLKHRDRMQTAMREELAYKREGMLEILDDQARFRQAQRYYSDLNLVFDAVDVACSQEL